MYLRNKLLLYIYLYLYYMNDLNTYLLESIMKKSIDVSLNALELLAFYTMIDATDCTEPLKETKHKLETALRSHITKLLREHQDIAKFYDYKTIFKYKTQDEANNLLDIIFSEINTTK